ncbi:helix-turn-helix domain-containing protein [Thiolapillus sp.]|uniref:helix-turn-helix domain-containing protein n=1 Tax=Thiolapillus sp. TaxID=2017437 RepID=UPI003AF7AB76
MFSTLQSVAERSEGQAAQNAIEEFYKTEHKGNIKSSFTRVIKLLSVYMDSIEMRGHSAEMTDAELLLVVSKQIIEKMSGAKSERHQLILEGIRRFNEMIERAGGTYTAEDVSELLGISTQAVGKRRRRNQLLAVRRGEHWAYPVWQFQGKKVVKGFKELLEELEGLTRIAHRSPGSGVFGRRDVAKIDR